HTPPLSSQSAGHSAPVVSLVSLVELVTGSVMPVVGASVVAESVPWLSESVAPPLIVAVPVVGVTASVDPPVASVIAPVDPPDADAPAPSVVRPASPQPLRAPNSATFHPRPRASFAMGGRVSRPPARQQGAPRDRSAQTRSRRP